MAAMGSRTSALGLVFAALCLAGCSGAATSSPTMVGLHLENWTSNAVVFSHGSGGWIGSPPPLSTYMLVVQPCGGHVDTDIRSATDKVPSPAVLLTDPSGEFDQQLALAKNNLDDVPSAEG